MATASALEVQVVGRPWSSRPSEVRGPTALVGLLMYGGGLRLGEALGLRVKDVDLARGEVNVRAGKGGKWPCPDFVDTTVRRPGAACVRTPPT
ncbi:MAG: tyrosine-type recombinase/integrase [Gemmatimonadales bacterium]